MSPVQDLPLVRPSLGSPKRLGLTTAQSRYNVDYARTRAAGEDGRCAADVSGLGVDLLETACPL